jgi:proline dehydrogenase
MYRTLFTVLAQQRGFKKVFIGCPWTAQVRRQLTAGTSWQGAHDTIAALVTKGLKATVGYLAEDARTPQQADLTAAAYLDILDQISREGWQRQVEVSINLVSLGLALRDGVNLASAHATKIAAKAHQIGAALTVDMEGVTTTTKTLRVVQALRAQYPDLGCVIQANLRRSEADCHNLAGPGSRVRLCKGAYHAPGQAVYTDRHDVNLSYVRCLKALMEGEGTPLVATHDPILVEIAQELAAHTNRGLRDFEFQMLYGVRTVEQDRLNDLGHIVRVYVPFGPRWYEYAVRRLSGRPANLWIFWHALVARH